MVKRDIIVIGASSGGVQAVGELISALPKDFPATVFVTVHLAPDHRSHLAEVLQKECSLPVTFAADSEKFREGHVYLASPNYHMVLDEKRIRITQGPKENRFRPAIDVLFRSAALAHGPRVIGIILTGALDDGSSGLFSIKERGGLAIVQDPEEAKFSSMPLNAIKAAAIDHVLPVAAMGQLLVRITSEEIKEIERSVSKQMESEVGIAMGDNGRMREIMALGKFTPYTCPECHGALVSLREGKLLRFRCHTGHAYTLSHLMADLTEHTENAIMNALRSVEETQLLMSEMKEHLEEDNQPEVAKLLEEKIKQAEKRGALIKQASSENEVISQDTLEGR